MPPAPTDSVATSLLVRARANDRTAWDRLADLFTPVVYNWVRHGGVPAADAEDVVQNVFFDVARGLAGFHRDRPGDTFGGWLRVLTRRRTCDYYRRAHDPAVGGSDARAVLEQVPDVVDDADPTDDPTAEVVRRGLEMIRPDFEPQTWRAFQRVAVDESPAADVAAELGLSVGSVYAAKSRVLKRLRQELDGLL